MATDFARQRAAQAWCKPTTEAMTMDPVLAEAFAEVIDEILWGGEPCLGFASTQELLNQMKARVDLITKGYKPNRRDINARVNRDSFTGHVR